ncbi:hypothetical protein WICPIJ_000323 [Wickerhamomyces pijperi]|uniref:Uncharacterized protein n=1 Tax=Wickerhamomyces pijperi TaxID=599730 RepID=A0A9P8QE20_WICPI|nr:hypothetical protein WICPIJ_000323 [Wickerhamomyces pijperi]
MSEPLQIETTDTRCKDIISDQRDIIHSIHSKINELWEQVRLIYEERDKINPESSPEEIDITDLQEAIDEFGSLWESADEQLSLDIIELLALDKEFQDMFSSKIEELKKLNENAFALKSKNLDGLDRLTSAKRRLDNAAATVGKINDVKLTNNGEPLVLDNLSKDQYLNLLNKERTKRAKLDFTNSKILQPQLIEVEDRVRSYRTMQQKWNKVISFDIKELDKSMAMFNKREAAVSSSK